MAKINAIAFSKIQSIIDDDKFIQIEKVTSGYEITIWENKGELQHSHYQGASLVEALMKIRG